MAPKETNIDFEVVDSNIRAAIAATGSDALSNNWPRGICTLKLNSSDEIAVQGVVRGLGSINPQGITALQGYSRDEIISILFSSFPEIFEGAVRS